MKVRIKIDCVVEVESIRLPKGVDVLDVVEKGISVLGATEIYPGAKLALNLVRKGR